MQVHLWRDAGQIAASPRFVFLSEAWAVIFAPRSYLEWVLKLSQLMSRGDFCYLPVPYHFNGKGKKKTTLACKRQLAKCQQKLLPLQMRWITLAVKIISDVLLRCLMGLLFKHG